MDNNNPVPEQPSQAVPPITGTVPPVQPGIPNMQPGVQPPVSPTPQAPTANTTGGGPASVFSEKKLLIWFGIGLVVIALLVGGAYLYLSRQQAATLAEPITGTSNIQPVVQDIPKPQDTVDALDRDLSALNVEDTGSNFTSVDEDLEQL